MIDSAGNNAESKEYFFPLRPRVDGTMTDKLSSVATSLVFRCSRRSALRAGRRLTEAARLFDWCLSLEVAPTGV